MAVCAHCKKNCTAVELEDETYEQIDMCGVESLMEVEQAIYEGLDLCETCYHKEMGI